MNKKVMTFVVAMVLLLGVTLGVTFALMTDNTYTITNTFVAGGFGDLHLEEEDGDIVADSSNQTNEYTMYPGATIPKDPKVSFINVDSGLNGYYVFVEITGKTENTTNWLSFVGNNATYKIPSAANSEMIELFTFEVDSAWTPVDGTLGVFYKKMSGSTPLSDTSVIYGDEIYMSNDVTLEDIQDYTGVDGIPLAIRAYAIQDYNASESTPATPAQAWAAVSAQA